MITKNIVDRLRIDCGDLLLQKELRKELDSAFERGEEEEWSSLLDLEIQYDLLQQETMEYLMELALRTGHEKLALISEMLGYMDRIPEILPEVHVPDKWIHFFQSLFQGREDVFARQYCAEGKSGYTPVKEPLQEAHIRQHLCGEQSYGIYTVQKNNTVKFFVLDIDIHKSALNLGTHSISELLHKLRENVKNNLMTLHKMNLYPLVEFSGYKGFHLWFFLHEPLPARVVRDFYKNYLKTKLQWGDNANVEFFPKQDKVPVNGYGNLIKLPLGKHAKSRRWSKLLDSQCRVAPDVYKMLADVKKLYRSEFLELCGLAAEAKTGSIPIDIQEGRKHETVLIKEAEHSEKLNAIFAGCAMLTALRAKILTYKSASKSEKHILTYVLAHLGDDGVAEIHRILSHCMGYNTDETNFKIRAVPPNPVSCPKIRQKLSEITDHCACNCTFPKKDGTYPTPLFHGGLEPVWVMNEGGSGRWRLKKCVINYEDETEKWITQYLELKSKQKEIKNRCSHIEQLLIKAVETVGNPCHIKLKKGQAILNVNNNKLDIKVREYPLLDHHGG